MPAAALVLRTDAFRAVGGFDPTSASARTSTSIWRLADAGHRIPLYERQRCSTIHRVGGWGVDAPAVGYGSSAGPLDARHPGGWHQYAARH